MMKVIPVLVAVFAVSLAKSVTVLRRAELSDELINNPRYLLSETGEGLFEVEDLEDTENANITLYATEDDVSFFIYTPENPSAGVQVRESHLYSIIKLTRFNINRPTLVIIHGWKNHAESPVNEQIKNSVLVANDINVVVADWSPIANRNYISAQGSVLAVGNYIGDFLLKLANELNHSIKKVALVGHSLGAHIAGNAGARINSSINTIIGLDPAGPLFSEKNFDNRLDPSDGKFVHVIHTNTRMLGCSVEMGHVDYFPNGGRSQPGCGMDLTGSCSHSRAYEYFAESINNGNFVSKMCDSYENFGNDQCYANTASLMGGYPIQQWPHGQYYLDTNEEAPFAQG